MSKILLPYAEQFDSMNENLARIAAAISSDMDISTWAGIQKAVRLGVAPNLIPVGTQLVVNHSVYGDMLYDVVAHDHYKSALDDNAHTMTLMCHDIITNVQYDAPEAFYQADSGLPSGVYNFTLITAYEQWAVGTYQFTLMKALPAGGQLRLNSRSTVAMTSCRVQSYESKTSTSMIEESVITVGGNGTNLGVFGIALNHPHRVSNGSNNYKESAIRQFLNSSAEAGKVWRPQTKFDVPPAWLTTLEGFVKGLDKDFLSVVGEVVVPCATNDIYESPDSTVTASSKYTLTDKFYIPSTKEIIAGDTASAEDGLPLFSYYKNAESVDRIKYKGAISTTWWTRSPYNKQASMVSNITTTGGRTVSSPHNSFGISPVCTIV